LDGIKVLLETQNILYNHNIRMSETFDFFIDKAKNNKNSNHIDINIPYPIQCSNKEKLSIKMIDFKYLNNVYNISSTLQNNTITLRKERDTYNPTIISQLRLPLNTIFFSNSEPTTNLRTNVELFSINGVKQELTFTNYKLTYFSPTIPSNNASLLINNIFIPDNQTNKITNFIAPTSYFILETSTIQDMVITGYSFAVNNSTSNNAIITTFIITIQGSNDNITYTTIPKTEATDNDVIFPIYSNIANFTKKSTNTYRDLTNNQSYKYYKVSFTTSQQSNSNILDLSNLQFRYAPYNLVLSTVPITPLNIQMTIPEGFYKSSTFIKTINDLLEPHYIKATLSPLNNKIELLNSYVSQNVVALKYEIYTNQTTEIMLFNNENIKTTYGINSDEIILQKDIAYIADNNINLTNFSKLIITSSLNFHNKTHNEIVAGSDNSTGIGNILTCIDNDEVPFTYIKYTNHEMLEQRLGNKSIANIRFSFYNERSNEIYLNDVFIHFQIIKSKK